MNEKGLNSLKNIICNEIELDRMRGMVEHMFGRTSDFNKRVFIPSIESCRTMSKQLSHISEYNEIFDDPRLMRAIIVAVIMYNYSFLNINKKILKKYQKALMFEQTSSDDFYNENYYCQNIYDHFVSIRIPPSFSKL